MAGRGVVKPSSGHRDRHGTIGGMDTDDPTDPIEPDPRGPGSAANAAGYLADVIAAIEATPTEDQRRPGMLALKLGVALTIGVWNLVERVALLIDEDADDDDDA